jgi:hypothetical protein
MDTVYPGDENVMTSLSLLWNHIGDRAFLTRAEVQNSITTSFVEKYGTDRKLGSDDYTI